MDNTGCHAQLVVVANRVFACVCVCVCAEPSTLLDVHQLMCITWCAEPCTLLWQWCDLTGQYRAWASTGLTHFRKHLFKHYELNTATHAHRAFADQQVVGCTECWQEVEAHVVLPQWSCKWMRCLVTLSCVFVYVCVHMCVYVCVCARVCVLCTCMCVYVKFDVLSCSYVGLARTVSVMCYVLLEVTVYRTACVTLGHSVCDCTRTYYTVCYLKTRCIELHALLSDIAYVTVRIHITLYALL